MEAQIGVFGLGCLIGWISKGLQSSPPPVVPPAPCHCHCSCECIQKEKDQTPLVLIICIFGLLACVFLVLYPRNWQRTVVGSPKGGGKDRGVYGVNSGILSILK
jgi:hypothetical protein